MKRKLLLMMASLLLAGAVSAQTNYWGNDPDSHAQPSNTPIVASVQIDGTAVTINENMRLGAFVGDDLHGIAAPHDGNFWIQVFYTAQTDNITFKFYDGETEYTTCETTLAGETVTLTGQDEGYGTPATPVVLNFTATQTQTTELAANWNWWSTPIELSNIDGLTMLEESLGHNGVTIKSQNYGVENYYQYTGSDYWYGQLSNYGINNEQGYLIKTSSSCSVTMSGTIANPANHEIELNQGWNWIGYPVNVQQNLTAALAGFTPTANDIIKSQSGGATYYAGYGWYPDTFVLTPGQSYQYKSNTSGNTLTYSVSRGADVVSEDSPHHWNNDVHSYPHNILVMATVLIDGVEQQRGDVELGAFVGGECRGSAKLDFFEPTGRWYAMLTITGVEGEAVEFGIYDGSCGETNMSCLNNITYVNNAVVGSLDTPFAVCFGTKEELYAYPNPVDRNQPFTIAIPNGETIKEMMFVNAMGEVLRCETGAFNMVMKSGLQTTGVYTIRVVCESGKVYHVRLIVK